MQSMMMFHGILLCWPSFSRAPFWKIEKSQYLGHRWSYFD